MSLTVRCCFYSAGLGMSFSGRVYPVSPKPWVPPKHSKTEVFTHDIFSPKSPREADLPLPSAVKSVVPMSEKHKLG